MDTYLKLAFACLFGGALIFLTEKLFPTVAPKLSAAASSVTSNSIASSSSQSTRLRTAYSVLDGYKHLSVQALTDPLAPNFTQQLLPSSLAMPARSKEEFAKHAGMVTSIFSSFAMLPIPGQVFEDPAQNAVVAHCRMVGELKNGLGPWENECMITMRFDESGTKVVEHREFVDSARAALLRQKLMAGKGGPAPNGAATESFTKS